jgi:hypothetical protein
MKSNARRLVSFFKKQWLTVWIIVVSLSLSAIIASAAFLDSNTNMKRVVVATALNGKMFSSDWLYENGITNNSSRRQQFSALTQAQIDEGGTYDVTVHIFNFDVDNPKKHYDDLITYDLHAKLVYADGSNVSATDLGTKTVTIEYGENSLVLSSSHPSDTTTITGEELRPNSNAAITSQNTYVLKFSGNWNLETDSNIYVQLEAVRTGDSANYRDITDLGGKIGISRSESGVSIGWDGMLSETGTPSGYDGYNFILTGSGEAVIEFEWDTSKISVNKYFYDVNLRNIAFDTGEVTYTAPSGESTWAKLIIHANSDLIRTDTKYRNRYEFQLYKSAGIEPPSDFVSVLVTTLTTEKASKTNKWVACTIRNVV